MHFCEGGFERINLYAESKTCCGSEVPMPGCCDDVSSFDLPNTDQQAFHILDFQPLNLDNIVPSSYVAYTSGILEAIEKTSFADTSPPIIHNTPIYIFCQVFLI